MKEIYQLKLRTAKQPSQGMEKMLTLSLILYDYLKNIFILYLNNIYPILCENSIVISVSNRGDSKSVRDPINKFLIIPI